MRPISKGCGTLTVAIVLAFPFGVLGQDISDAGAQGIRSDLLLQADAQSLAQNHRQALALFERAGQILMTPSLRRAIAEEQTELGRFVDALGSAHLCIVEEHQRPTSGGHHDEVLAACGSLVETLPGRTAHVVMKLPTPVPEGLHVTVNNKDLPSLMWGIPYVVDPGTIVVDARAPGVQDFHREVKVDAGGSADVAVSLVPKDPPSTTPRPPDMGRDAPVLRTVGLVLLSTATLPFVTGVVAHALEQNATQAFNSEPLERCNVANSDNSGGGPCPTLRSAAEDATRWKVAGYVSAGGLAAAAIGVFLADNLTRKPRSAVSLAPGPGDVGFALCGTF